MTGRLVIAVDGPAASGKGTLSKRIAERFDLAYLDTGLLYRAVAAKIAAAGVDPADAAAAAAAARSLSNDDLARDDLRSAGVGAAASFVAAHPDVRAELLDYQRAFAAGARPEGRGAVLDGRDIGSVVCPDAALKVFVTAHVEERARRRWRDLLKTDPDLAYETVLQDLQARDERDRTRTASPMAAAPGAHLLDTSDLDIDAAVAALSALVERIA